MAWEYIPPGASQTLHYGNVCRAFVTPAIQVVNDSGAWKEGRICNNTIDKVIMVAQSTLVITLVHEERHDAKSILWIHMLEKQSRMNEWLHGPSWPLILCALPIPMRLLPITATQLGTNSGFTLYVGNLDSIICGDAKTGPHW